MTLDSEAGESAEGSRVISFIRLFPSCLAGEVSPAGSSLFFIHPYILPPRPEGRFFAAHIAAECRIGKAGARLRLYLLVQYSSFYISRPKRR